MVPATLSAEIAIAFYEGDTTRCSVSLYTGNASKFVHCDAYHSGFLGLLLLLFHVRSNLPDTISETSKTLLLSIILPYAQCNSSVWPRGIPRLPPDVAVHMRIRPGACVPFVAVVGDCASHDATESFLPQARLKSPGRTN